MTSQTSPLLGLPGAVAGDGVDAPVAAHYGSFNLEQRALEGGEGFVDLSHREVVRVEGPDRLTWLHSLTTQHLEALQPGVTLPGLVLDPQGHVEHAFVGSDDGAAFTFHTEPGQAAALVEFLERMKFMMRAELTDVTSSYAVTWRPGRGDGYERYELVPRDQLTAYADAAGPAA
ncbi:MAG TPA: folate-binding protein, partial [Nocardioides sp.]|nr:folate-binding protein [Nocardioides sp.]